LKTWQANQIPDIGRFFRSRGALAHATAGLMPKTSLLAWLTPRTKTKNQNQNERTSAAHAETENSATLTRVGLTPKTCLEPPSALTLKTAGSRVHAKTKNRPTRTDQTGPCLTANKRVKDTMSFTT